MKALLILFTLFAMGCGGKHSDETNPRAVIYPFKSWAVAPACTAKYAGYSIVIEEENLSMYSCKDGVWTLE